MKKMLWGGRFDKAASGKILEFNSAENAMLDGELVSYDILGSLAHAKMLMKQGIITQSEHDELSRALRAVHKRWKEGAFRLNPELEDVHMNVESAVSGMTPAGKKLHTARSRNDQVLLDMRLYMRDKTLLLINALDSLRAAFAAKSRGDGPMVAYTHTRVAQPVTVSFWCAGWSDSLGRDIGRLEDAYKRINQNPLGACAVSGTPWKIDRRETARLLGFASVQENEFDTINSRGECEAEMLSALSLIMCKLSRMSEELVWLSQKGLIDIAEEHTTGSSIMPNKKNPDALELIRGRSGRVYGNLSHCLVSLKGLMSGYNSDMQETKFAVMGGIRTTLESIAAMEAVVAGLGFDFEKIRAELDSGFAQATEVADYLAMGGLPFREAHERAGKLVLHCEKQGKTISALGATEASLLLGAGISEKEWDALRGFERKRLRRNVITKKSPFAEKERVRIKKAFDALI